MFCLELVDKYRKEYGVSVMAYCLMPNHFHLLICQKIGGSISKFLQTTFNAYTQAVNVQRKRSGTLFQGRAKARRIEDDSVALHLVRYFHLNPVEAGLVDAPGSWEFSDFRVWCGQSPPMVTDLRLRDAEFTDAAEYARFVEARQDETARLHLHKYMFEEAM
jgi:putative transposase